MDLLRQRVIYSGRVKNNIVVMDNIAYEVEDELAKKIKQKNILFAVTLIFITAIYRYITDGQTTFLNFDQLAKEPTFRFAATAIYVALIALSMKFAGSIIIPKNLDGLIRKKEVSKKNKKKKK